MSGRSSKKQDVYVQDQTTPPIEHYIGQVLNDSITIASPVTKGAYVISLGVGHGFIDPSGFDEDFIDIYYVDDTVANPFIGIRFFQACVISVNGNDITIGTHVPFDIDPTKVEAAHRVNTNMNKVGTLAAPVKFTTTPPNGIAWDITRVMISMITATEPDDSEFGDIARLINGVFCGCESDEYTQYTVNIKDNQGFRDTAFDVVYVPRSVPLGAYGISVRKTFAGPEKYGVAMRLEGLKNRKFVKYIQDDLTGILRYRLKVMGHVVQF